MIVLKFSTSPGINYLIVFIQLCISYPRLPKTHYVELQIMTGCSKKNILKTWPFLSSVATALIVRTKIRTLKRTVIVGGCVCVYESVSCICNVEIYIHVLYWH